MSPMHIHSISRLPLGTRALAMGNRGEDVRELQRLLHQEGFYPAEPDGIFGPATDEAVFQFQRANRLKTDGLVGPAVLRALRAPRDSSGSVHVVAGGGSLDSVARNLGLPTEILARANRMSSGGQVYPGQRLIVPSHFVALWADGPGRARTALPGLSFAAVSVARVEMDGRLDPSGTRVQEWVSALNIPLWPVIVGESAAWGRLLRRPDRWESFVRDARGFCDRGPLVLCLEDTTVSDRRRLNRLIRRMSAAKHGGMRLYLTIPILAHRRFPAKWAKMLRGRVEGVILGVGIQSGPVNRVRDVLRQNIPRLPGRVFLGVALSGLEEGLDEAARVIESRDISHFEARVRAAGCVSVTGGNGEPFTALYRRGGSWRRATFLDGIAISEFCEAAVAVGACGVIFRGLEEADSRLYRAIPEMFGKPGVIP